MSWRYRYTIHGRPVSKKNGHRVRFRGGRPFVGNSDSYKNWENDAILELRSQRGRVPTIEKPQKVGASIVLWLAKGQHELDVDNALGAPFDAIERAGIVENDRQLRIVRLRQLRDQRNPRIEIELTQWKD